ncbi:MAG: caspase family protein [Pseudomonadales bacterium]
MKILYMTASPFVTEHQTESGQWIEKEYPKLDLWPELKIVTEALFDARAAGDVSLDILPEVSAADLPRYLNAKDFNIVHFSGHGDKTGKLDAEGNEEAGLILQVDVDVGEYVDNTWLRDQFANRGIDVLVLNCCWSEPVAEKLAGSVGLVVGTTCPLRSDDAALFTQCFYEGIEQGLTLRQIVNKIKDKTSLGDQLYEFKVQDESVWDKVVRYPSTQAIADAVPRDGAPPTEDVAAVEDAPPSAQQIYDLECRMRVAVERCLPNLGFDLLKLLGAALVAYAASVFLRDLGNPADWWEFYKHCVTTETRDMGLLGDFLRFLTGAVNTSQWIVYEPYAIMAALSARPGGRVLGALWLLWDHVRDKGVLPLLTTQSEHRIRQELASGRVEQMSTWLKEFER